MQDRVSLYPGRVKMIPVAGQENTYDMVRADSPTQEGTPLSKATLLTDDVASMYSMGTDAVPDDIFRFLSHLIPYGKGLVSVRVVDGDGNPVERTVSVSPSIDGSSSVTTDGTGFFRAVVDAGTYTFSAGSSGLFETVSPASAAVQVSVGKAAEAKFSVAKKLSGEVDLTTTQTLTIPDWLTNCDLFAVGGGGSGAAGGNTQVSGGGGGYTATVKGRNLAGKAISVQIGAGGAAVTHTSGGNGTHGKSGGVTSVSVEESVILSANGGKFGSYYSPGGTRYSPDGGSGGGGGTSGQTGGTDGGNGGNSGGNGGGTGQGTTTRKFGEAGNTLYSGGGGGAYGTGSPTALTSASGGSGGGGNGAAEWGTSNQGGNASFYGGGGGGAIAYTSASSSNYTTVSGKGYQGLVSIRWNMEG